MVANQNCISRVGELRRQGQRSAKILSNHRLNRKKEKHGKNEDRIIWKERNIEVEKTNREKEKDKD